MRILLAVAGVFVLAAQSPDDGYRGIWYSNEPSHCKSRKPHSADEFAPILTTPDGAE